MAMAETVNDPPTNAIEEADERLSVSDLVRMFEEAEESTDQARRDAQRDRDYYDNIQLTGEQLKELEKRGQPPVIINRIRRKVNYLIGLEKQQRTMPRGLPRTPQHEQDATAATDALRFVADTEDYHAIRSAVWKNLLIEGAAAVCVSVTPKAASKSDMMASTAMTPPAPDYDVKLRYYAWDRFFWDPHSSRTDFSDSNYHGVVLWMDYADAISLYPDAGEIIEGTMSTVSMSDTYDDNPKWSVWADRKRRRIRVVQMWIKRNDEWHFAEFTKGGILKSGPSPYRDENGKTECEVIGQSAYCDRENRRYGMVREMISVQDEINKRRSKALHLLNTNQMIFEEGAFQDENKAREQGSRPDGFVKVNPSYFEKFRFEQRTDMASGQFQLLQESKNEIDLMGANAAMQGDNGTDASGRAILASQQGGMIEINDLLDNLRHFDKQVFRAIWSRIRQYWTAPKWIRVTDDERNVRFVGINQPKMQPVMNPQTGQPVIGQDGKPVMQPVIDPRTGQPVIQSVAELDVDIIIDDAPDTVAPAIEQFQTLVELKKYDANNEISFRSIVEAAPNLRNKEKLLESMDERAKAQQQQPNPQVAALQAKMQMEQQSQQADLAAKQQDMELDRQKAEQELALKERMAQLEMEMKRQSEMMRLFTEQQRAQQQREIEGMKAHASMANQAEAARQKAQQPRRAPVAAE